ncbi:hypothetical protein [Gandjariella thermophila]|uniref:SCO6045-like C-terminal domain-containing protein n=1 Tax=Gandjariella thermophila TaxID=1931992 RepID=A0A4D4JC70_9PSEU|nr:hypothetical protein [Gandjariella thermophila]GDY32952.1 hypothetical protein GTS_45850 [Gandjariella thermophila]
MTERAHADLAARQQALLTALLAGGPVPAGFDPARLRAQADALRAKRRRVVAALRPDLPHLLGEEFPARFDEYARANPRRTGTGAADDAAAFAAWLAARGLLAARHARRRRWWRRRADIR